MDVEHQSPFSNANFLIHSQFNEPLDVPGGGGGGGSLAVCRWFDFEHKCRKLFYIEYCANTKVQLVY